MTSFDDKIDDFLKDKNFLFVPSSVYICMHTLKLNFEGFAEES
jgi:hypothetical protein